MKFLTLTKNKIIPFLIILTLYSSIIVSIKISKTEEKKTPVSIHPLEKTLLNANLDKVKFKKVQIVQALDNDTVNGTQVMSVLLPNSTVIFVPNTTNVSNLISPFIDNNRNISDGSRHNYEPVNYVKEISAAGKASLELRSSGE